MVLLHCHCISTADIISGCMLFVTILILIVGYIQSNDFIKTKKIDFTYQFYMDLFTFLNDDRNKVLKSWFYGEASEEIKVNSEDWIKIGQLLEKFEAVAALKNRGALDDKIYYELISSYIDEVFAYSKNPKVMEYIEYERKERKEVYNLTDSEDLYKGTIDLKNASTA